MTTRSSQSRREFLKAAAAGAAAVTLGQLGCSGSPGKKRPNIIYILADDLGYGELGCYGQEKILTPNIDALAAAGMRFTQHYSGSPVCAPSRCTLLTGKHTGHAYIRGNDEWGSRGNVWDYLEMIRHPELEGQRPIPADTETVGKMLQRQGYTTACIGKWGLGAPGTEGVPNKQGFDLFFGYNCQRQAHTYYPKHLWRNEEKVILDNRIVAPHANLAEGADPDDPESYADFTLNEYSPDLMGREALAFIEENQDNPFFLYFSTTIPHLPIQAPPAYVQMYREKFGEEEPYTGTGYFPHRYPRAGYAGMITYLDDQVGALVKKLKDLGLYDNTLIMFSSDNGPTYTGGVDVDFFNSAGPFQNGYGRTKGFTYEGGIRVPFIACWPGVIRPGSVSDRISAFWDLFPTLAEVAGAPAPGDSDGISFLPDLKGRRNPGRHEFLYWEFPAYAGQQAVRMGRWKGIRKNIFQGNMTIELYDLENDLRETTDVADAHPDIVAKIEAVMREQHVPAELERFKITQLGDA
ncbi:arylsulfatase [bacterium]|nr:arylsulfatase [bacterium]